MLLLFVPLRLLTAVASVCLHSMSTRLREKLLHDARERDKQRGRRFAKSANRLIWGQGLVSAPWPVEGCMIRMFTQYRKVGNILVPSKNCVSEPRELQPIMNESLPKAVSGSVDSELMKRRVSYSFTFMSRYLTNV